MVVLSWLLVLTALIYTFVIQRETGDQVIDLTVAARNAPAKYPLEDWTPENWYKEVLNLPLADESTRTVIAYNLRIMRGWKYNLIAFFLAGLVLVSTVLSELFRSRRARPTYDETK